MARLSFCAEVKPLGVNRAYAPARWGNRHGFRKTPEAHAYAEAIGAAIPLASMLRGPVGVTLKFYWPTAAGDVDAPIKLTLDALQGHAIENDRQVQLLHVERLTDKARPRVEVVVEELVPLTVAVDGEAVARERKAMLACVSPKRREDVLKKRLVSSVRRPE